uniref:Putative secreted protein n=1 Tax=Anopheles darlingi TaxID=43151 RepID=A0A2M4DJI2_ANODA
MHNLSCWYILLYYLLCRLQSSFASHNPQSIVFCNPHRIFRYWYVYRYSLKNIIVSTGNLLPTLQQRTSFALCSSKVKKTMRCQGVTIVLSANSSNHPRWYCLPIQVFTAAEESEILTVLFIFLHCTVYLWDV